MAALELGDLAVGANLVGAGRITAIGAHLVLGDIHRLLVVDAAQGVEAQTLANLYVALDNKLEIVPVLNKIDLPAANPEQCAEELAGLIGCEPEDCLKVSGKTGVGVEPLLDEIVRQFPSPVGDADAPSRAMSSSAWPRPGCTPMATPWSAA